jgi:hypothetical protein
VVLPLVFGKTLELHPLVVLLGVAAGGQSRSRPATSAKPGSIRRTGRCAMP